MMHVSRTLRAVTVGPRSLIGSCHVLRDQVDPDHSRLCREFGRIKMNVRCFADFQASSLHVAWYIDTHALWKCSDNRNLSVPSSHLSSEPINNQFF